MTNLVIADHDNRRLKPETLSTVTAALALGGDVHVLVAGAGCSGVAEEVASVAGVQKVLVMDDPQLAHLLPEVLTPSLVGLAADYQAVLAPATSMGKNLLPRVAALLDVAQLSDVTRVLSADTFERPMYAGNVVATVRSLDNIRVLTVRASAFDRASKAESAQAAPIQPLPAELPSGLPVSFVDEKLTQSERPELGSARVVVAGGRGLQSADNFRLLESLADRLNAAIGASRAAVDAGYVSNDLQVGQTGKVVAPELYIAVGISGAIQHLAGMKDSKVVVAINKDPEAPIFQAADYGLVGDLFTVLPELEALL